MVLEARILATLWGMTTTRFRRESWGAFHAPFPQLRAVYMGLFDL